MVARAKLISLGLLALWLGSSAIAETASTRPAYDQFLFIRHNEKGGAAVTDTLVMGTVLPDRFELKDVYTQNNFHVGARPLCVVGGKIYIIHTSDLLCIDIESGRCTRVAEYASRSMMRGTRLYSIASAQRGSVLRVYDFAVGASRDLMPLDMNAYAEQPCISPDEKRCAWYDQRRMAQGSEYVLTVADIATGKVTQPFEPIDYTVFSFRDRMGTTAPLLWLDNDTLLGIRTTRGKDEPMPNLHLFRMSLKTGKSEDVALLPREVSDPGDFLAPADGDISLFSYGGHGATARCRIDLTERKVFAADTRVGRFMIGGGGYLEWTNQNASRLRTADGKVLEEARDATLSVCPSPDGMKLLWRATPGNRSRAALCYCDSEDGKIRTVCEEWFAPPFAWFNSGDLKPAEAVKVPEGWTAFKHETYPPPRQPDTRPDIGTILKLKVQTDKAVYDLHEPVRMTFTLTNTGDRDIDVRELMLDRRSISLTLTSPRFSKMVSMYYANDDTCPCPWSALRKGASMKATLTLEVSSTGVMSLAGNYSGYANGYRGSVKVPAWSFEVKPSADRKLLDEKAKRILDTLRVQHQRNPQWDGWCPAQSDLEDVGPEIAPYLIAAIKAERDAVFRKRLLRPLWWVANPDAIGLYREWLNSDNPDERSTAVNGLAQLYRRKTGSADAAVDLLAQAVRSNREASRRQAAGVLREIDSSLAKVAFEQALDSTDEQVRDIAARYLAAHEGLDLAGWLGKAIERPTRARLLAARVIIRQLESDWRQKHGELPEGDWAAIEKDPVRLTKYREVLRSWLTWTAQNSAASEAFFRPDRQSWERARQR